MPSDVTIENKRPVTRGSKHVATAMADVCLTPQGAAVVPVPYVNTAKSKYLKNGSRKVKISGHWVMLKQSRLAQSSGNELGKLGGVKSKTTRGACIGVPNARLVTIEGRAVVLGTACTTQNNGNALGRFSS